MSHYVGIDVSKNKLDICWLREPHSNKKKSRVVPNHRDGHEQTIVWLLQHICSDAQDIWVVVEPTGIYHEALLYRLHDEGFKVILANPGKAKQYGQALGLTHKTDKGDAAMLARYGQSQSLPQWEPEAHEIRELKAMMRRLDGLEKDLQREKSRHEAYESGSAPLRVMQSLEYMIDTLESEISKLTNDIDDHIDRHPKMKSDRELLESIRGVGRVLSREMVYLLSSKRFSCAKQVAAYAGLIPRLQESGMWKGRTSLSKTGPARLRAKLYMAAVCASTHNPDIRRQKKRLLDAGKTPMQALGAAMRKLLQICFGVIKHQSEYRPQCA